MLRPLNLNTKEIENIIDNDKTRMNQHPTKKKEEDEKKRNFSTLILKQ